MHTENEESKQHTTLSTHWWFLLFCPNSLPLWLLPSYCCVSCYLYKLSKVVSLNSSKKKSSTNDVSTDFRYFRDFRDVGMDIEGSYSVLLLIESKIRNIFLVSDFCCGTLFKHIESGKLFVDRQVIHLIFPFIPDQCVLLFIRPTSTFHFETFIFNCLAIAAKHCGM